MSNVIKNELRNIFVHYRKQKQNKTQIVFAFMSTLHSKQIFKFPYFFFFCLIAYEGRITCLSPLIIQHLPFGCLFYWFPRFGFVASNDISLRSPLFLPQNMLKKDSLATDWRIFLYILYDSLLIYILCDFVLSCSWHFLCSWRITEFYQFFPWFSRGKRCRPQVSASVYFRLKAVFTLSTIYVP